MESKVIEKKDNTYCSVPQCKSKGSNVPNVSFHKFPDIKSVIRKTTSDGSKVLVNRRNEWKRLLKIGKEISKRMTVCSKHFEVDAFNFPPEKCLRARLKPYALPTLFLPKTSTYSEEKIILKKENSAKRLSHYSELNRILGDKSEEGSREMVKMKRKSTTSEKIKPLSNKKLNSSSKLNGTHTSNHVQASEKSTGSKSKDDKPMCTNPETFAYLNIKVKKELLSDEETPGGPSRDNAEKNISENVQITNVRSLSSERSIEGSPSAEVAAAKIQNAFNHLFILSLHSLEVNTPKKSDEDLDSNFYSKPLDMDQRDKAFGSFVACELSDLRANPALYMKTKQAILKLLTEAHFEQMSSSKKS